MVLTIESWRRIKKFTISACIDDQRRRKP